MSSSLYDNVEISLIINDTTSTIINLNLSQTTNELIVQICDDLTQRFTLDERTKFKLFNHICKELSVLQKEKEKKEEIEAKRDEYCNQLYYREVKDKKEKEEYYKKLRQENDQRELEQYSFTPTINILSSKLYKRQYNRIEDRLYGDAKVIGNKKRYQSKENKSFTSTEMMDLTNQLDGNTSIRPKANFKIKDARRDEPKYLDFAIGSNDSIFNEDENKNKLNDDSLSMNKYKDKTKFSGQSKPYNKKIVKQKQCFHIDKPKANFQTYNNGTEGNEAIKAHSKKSNLFDKYTSTKQKPKSNIDIRKSKIIERDSFSKIIDLTSENYHNKSKKDINVSNSSRVINTLNRKDWIHRHSNQTPTHKNVRRERELNQMYDEIYPFKPLISEKSQRMIIEKKKESKDRFVDRLSQSKKANFVKSALHNIHSISITEPNSVNKSMYQRKYSQSSKKGLFKQDTEKNIRTENIETAQSTNPHTASFSDKKRITPEAKQELAMLRSVMESERKSNYNKQQYINQFETNVEKFKLNQLKDIYEILTKNGGEIDIESLTTNGIPKHIRDRIIVPTCYMINNKNLEFNFQNFYLIAKEILNKFF